MAVQHALHILLTSAHFDSVPLAPVLGDRGRCNQRSTLPRQFASSKAVAERIVSQNP